MIRTALIAAMLTLAALSARSADAPIGMFTIVEGDLVVLRDTREFAAAEGLRLRSEDIVRSSAGTRLARIELGDGTVLDLGPQTELLLQPRALAAPERNATLYLLRGWLKVSTPASAGGAGFALASPRIDVARLAGNVVVHALPQASLVFVETGRGDVIDRSDGKAGATHTLKDGDAFASRAALPGALLRRPPPDLVEGLPRAFADSLPRRIAQWQGAIVDAGAGTELSYADASPWINAEAVLRPGFVQRFGPLVRDRSFRTGLVAELRAHPEWDRLLYPEKYRPKPPVAVAAKRSPLPPGAETLPAAWLEALEPGLSKAPLAQLRWPGAERGQPQAKTETR
jgi:hypothetical protein